LIRAKTVIQVGPPSVEPEGDRCGEDYDRLSDRRDRFFAGSSQQQRTPVEGVASMRS